MPILTAEERVGTVLGGRYRLDAILGSGGTSTVYRAAHSFTKRSVALKLLKPEHSRDRGLVARFLKEARVASTLVHPNVVAILDMGTEDGDTYLAMELLEGRSLAALLGDEGPLPAERAITLLRPVMEAIRAAHEKGIVHRDLKPENILVGDRGDGVQRAIVLDFGMAKTNDAAWGHATQSGVIVGTPFYMSPEQAEGANDVGPPSDVWSMGVLLYRAFSGEQPFNGTSPTALLLAIARGDHVRLEERAPTLAPALAAWVEGALVVDRAGRYPDMSAMLAALDRALDGEILESSRATRTSGIVVRTSSAGDLPAVGAEPPARPSRAPMVAAAAIAVAVLALLALASQRSGTAPPATSAEVAATPTTTVVAAPPPPPDPTAVLVAPPARVAVEPAVEEVTPPPPTTRSGRGGDRHRPPRTGAHTPATDSATTTSGHQTGLLEEW